MIRQALIISVLFATLASCAQPLTNRYNDQQICYRARVFLDGWALGYRAFGESHFGTYNNFMGMREEFRLTMNKRPELFGTGAQSCEARFPEVNAPLPEFVQKMEGVIPVPNFYRTLLAGQTPYIPNQQIQASTLVTLGLIAAAGGAFAPPPPLPQYIFLMPM